MSFKVPVSENILCFVPERPIERGLDVSVEVHEDPNSIVGIRHFGFPAPRLEVKDYPKVARRDTRSGVSQKFYF